MDAMISSLLILAPLFGGALALILGLLKLRLTAGIMTLLSLLSGLGVAIRGALLVATESGALADGTFVAGGWLPGVGITLRYDGVAAAMGVLLFLVAFLVLLHAVAEGESRPLFFGVYAIALGGMVGVVLSADLFNLFVFFEVLSLAAAILVAYERTLPAMQAAFRYLLMATLSISLYLLGLFILYRITGELSFPAVARSLEGAVGSGEARLGMALLFCAIATRVALFPFHGWLPEAHGEAPRAVSALLSGLMLKAGFVAFWHVLQLFPAPEYLELLAWIGAFSALFGAAAALAQEDAKRLLAFSSISQLGYIAAAAGAGAFAASFYHLLSHAFYKSLLFLLVGGWVHRWGVRSIDGLREKRSGGTPSSREERIKALLLVLGVAAIIGLPPFSAFASKGLMGALMKGSPVYGLIQVAGVLTAAALLKLGLLAIPRGGEARTLAPAAGATEAESGAKSGSLGTVVLFGLLIPTVALGTSPGLLLRLLARLRVIEPAIPTMIEGFELYGPSRLLNAFWPAALGLLLLALLRTGVGRRLTLFASRLRLGVDGAMALVSLGTTAVAALLLF